MVPDSDSRFDASWRSALLAHRLSIHAVPILLDNSGLRWAVAALSPGGLGESIMTLGIVVDYIRTGS
jgi:hypothetical protein